MKTNNFLICAAIMTLAFCARGATALAPGIGMTTNFTALNVSITVITNGPVMASGNTSSSAVGKVTINNNYLLKVFSYWAHQYAWPAGTKLVIGWDDPWDGDVLVVDGSGTNVLFDASNTGVDAGFTVQFGRYGGAASGKEVSNDSDPVSFNHTSHSRGYFELADDNVYLPDTDLSLNASSSVTFTQNLNAEGYGTTWNLTASLTAGDDARGEVFLGNSGVTVNGTVSTSGSGKGANYTFGP